jgi:four helix bundle protein
MQDYKKILVWEKSHMLTLSIYNLTHSFSKEEMYGLTSQIRRLSASVPINIAEGCGRGSDADFKRFCKFLLDL